MIIFTCYFLTHLSNVPCMIFFACLSCRCETFAILSTMSMSLPITILEAQSLQIPTSSHHISSSDLLIAIFEDCEPVMESKVSVPLLDGLCSCPWCIFILRSLLNITLLVGSRCGLHHLSDHSGAMRMGELRFLLEFFEILCIQLNSRAVITSFSHVYIIDVQKIIPIHNYKSTSIMHNTT